MAFILISEAAKITGLERQTIRNWMDKGIVPFKVINGTYYVDSDTFEALAGDMRGTEAARMLLARERDAYLRERDEYKSIRTEASCEYEKERRISYYANIGIRTGFFNTITDMMCASGILSDRERDILCGVLNGKSLESLSTTRERARLVAEKALRKSRNLTKVMDVRKKDEEIARLKEENSLLKKMVYRKVTADIEKDLSDKERSLLNMGADLYRTLSMDFSYNVSVRTQNILEHYRDENGNRRIKNLGELCRLTEKDILQQRNAGKKTVEELTRILDANGLTWGMDIDKILDLRR